VEEIIDAVHYVEQNPQKIGLLPQEWSFVTTLQQFLKSAGCDALRARRVGAAAKRRRCLSGATKTPPQQDKLIACSH
jgi:hypothetical protein